MSKKQKLIERIQRRPRDFTWDEAASLMEMCGFTLVKNSGSRRYFRHRDDTLVMGFGASPSAAPAPAEQKPPTIPDEIWQSLPPKARALVEDIVHKSHEGKIKEEDLVLLLSTTDRLSQSDP